MVKTRVIGRNCNFVYGDEGIVKTGGIEKVKRYLRPVGGRANSHPFMTLIT